MVDTPRQRIVYTAVQQLRAHGVEATGLRPLVAAAEAPWGSFAHYFPGGKEQVVCEALGWAGAFAATVVEDYARSARTPSARGLWHAIVGWWIADLRARDFALGCPVAAAIVDSAHGSDAIRAAASDALQVWRAPIRQALVDLGIGARDAGELATVMLAALEGAILLARVKRSVAPLQVTERRLLPLFTQ